MKTLVYFFFLISFGIMTKLSASEANDWNFLGIFVIRENNGEDSQECFYPVQKDSFSVPPDWNPGDKFDRTYMLTNITPELQRLWGTGRVVKGQTATISGEILTLYDFEILLKHPVQFSKARKEFSCVEEVHYVSRKVKVNNLEQRLKPIKFYFNVPIKEFRINYENRSEGRLCVDRDKIPEDYFPPSDGLFIDGEMESCLPAPILKGDLKIPPLPSYMEDRGKLPKDFWKMHYKNFQKAYAGNDDNDSFRFMRTGFRAIEDCFSEPEGGIHRLLRWPLVFDPRVPSLEFDFYPPERSSYNEKALEGAIFALKALLEYWQEKRYEDYRVEYLAHWIEIYEASQNESEKK